MIRLFVTDLDGCVSHPFRAPDWDALLALVRLHEQHGQDPGIPPVTICTGRPMSYAEAVAQWLSVTTPILFESGSGMYDPVNNRVWWSPRITETTEQALQILRREIHGHLVPRYPGTVAELGKQKDVGLTNPDRRAIDAMYSHIAELVARHDGADLEVHCTDVSVNVIPRTANKGTGLQWLAEHLGIDLADMAYIGDSQGDISALAKVGWSFAPANATAAVKTVAHVVTRAEATAGVLEAYQAVVAHNREQSRSS